MIDPRTVRRRLRNIRRLNSEVKALEKQIATIRNNAVSSGGFSTKMHSIQGYVTSKLENCVLQIIGLEDRLDNKRLALIGAMEVAETMFDLLNENELPYITVLRYLYVLGYTQERTADAMGYTDRRIRQLEWEAVKKISARTNANNHLAKRLPIIS